MPRPRNLAIVLDGTNRSLQNLYRAYNNFYFANQLDPEIRVRFSQKPMKRVYAYYDSPEEEIVIDKRILFNKKPTPP